MSRERRAAGAGQGGGNLGCALPPDSGLTGQGWQRRCNAEPRRLGEIVESDLGAECGGCKETMVEFKAADVRKRAAAR